MLEETGFSRAMREFNGGRYFECHDILEALWVDSSGEEKIFLQGMIQVSVGFYHFFNGNPSGALSQWGKGTRKLSGFPQVHAGIDVGRLLGRVRDWSRAAARELGGEPDQAFDMQGPTVEIIHNSLRREPWPQ
jgi:predicted metal-dependent hydrolase